MGGNSSLDIGRGGNDGVSGNLVRPLDGVEDGGVLVPVHRPLDGLEDGGVVKRPRVYNMSHLQKRKKKLNRHRGRKQKNSATYRAAVDEIGDHSLQLPQVREIIASIRTSGTRRVRRASKLPRWGVRGESMSSLLKSNAALRGRNHRWSEFYCVFWVKK